ncbi:MAG TPA: GH25 family lysozyme [Actinospica sp.]|nr:GH25 family lysozyme [Actinospica sp.]
MAAGAVLAAALVLTLDQVAGSRPGEDAPGASQGGSAFGGAADAVGARAADGGTGASWARAATGDIVPVTPTDYQTPVHPEEITHPDADAMGESAGDAVPAAATLPLDGSTGFQAATGVPQLPGIDVSSHQGAIDWAKVAPHVDFVYAKATEGTYYRNADFTNQYDGPYDHGVMRGAYHFAVPSNSSGTAQADYFIAHGGAWSGDGLTLPGTLDIEYNPYGKSACYGLTPAQMTGWISNFVTEYAAREHAYPVIYSTANWWRTCTGNAASFAALDPVWIANYGSSTGPLPNGWHFYTFWQHADSGSLPGDQDVFNGPLSQLRVLAKNG